MSATLHKKISKLETSLKLARDMLGRALPDGVTGSVIKNRLGAYNSRRKRDGESPYAIEEYIYNVTFSSRDITKRVPRTVFATSGDELIRLADEENARRETELQAETKRHGEAWAELNVQRKADGRLPVSWNTYCRDNRIGIHAEREDV